MPFVTFESLTPADASALSAIALQAYRDHYLDYWYDHGAWYMQRSFAPEQLAIELADPTARFFLIKLHDESVGFLKINLDKPLPNQPAVSGLELERIYLVHRATGQGVGQVAMRFVEGIARERGSKVLWLKAMDTSPAVGFYKRAGFRECGTFRLTFPQMKEELRGMITLQKSVRFDE